jgi:putative membrane protein insertion efficiency factor
MSNLPEFLIRGSIRGYQIAVSPLLHWVGGPGSGCRFQPSCSEYCLEAVTQHGAGRGLWLGVRRIARCNPWGGAGFDPVPAKSIASGKVGSKAR